MNSIKKVFAKRRKSLSNLSSEPQSTFYFEDNDSGYTSVSSKSFEYDKQSRSTMAAENFNDSKQCFNNDNIKDANILEVEDAATLAQLLKLQSDVSRLKLDKLELLRQNVEAHREVKK